MLGGAFAGRGVQGLTGRYDCGGAFSWWRWGFVGEDEKCGTLGACSSQYLPVQRLLNQTINILHMLTYDLVLALKLLWILVRSHRI